MNKTIILLSFVFSILIIGIPTIKKVMDNNSEMLYKVVNQKISEAAKKCYIDEVCTDDKITLKTLYENNYLENNISDPVTKAVYSLSSYVDVSDGFIFYSL